MMYEQKESNNRDRYYIKKPKRNYGVEKYNNKFKKYTTRVTSRLKQAEKKQILNPKRLEQTNKDIIYQ